MASKPNAEERSMSSYPYEFHSRRESRITGTNQFLGLASAPLLFSSLPSLIVPFFPKLYVHFTYTSDRVKARVVAVSMARRSHEVF
jgi:hypothetical protein